MLWVVPEFPVNDEDHRYVFLKNEARMLMATGRVQLTIVTETGGPHVFGDLDMIPLKRSGTYLQQLRMVMWNLSVDPPVVSNRLA